ncbi:hypothetical protein [Xanthomonas euvesicatoria]|uniref:hypothetical protein n=1 Tax=Xanthomonas euvesicatoria TaxID=456327 RepID=UPI000F8C7CF2|nr:hypothetical protein [Xanthomonas euvesicatoria]
MNPFLWFNGGSYAANGPASGAGTTPVSSRVVYRRMARRVARFASPRIGSDQQLCGECPDNIVSI